MIRSGIWLGRSGKSGLTLKIKEGKVSGTINSAHGRPSPSENFDLLGFTDGELIGFSVLWKNSKKHYHSVASWTGRYVKDGDGERIEAAWHLCRKYSDKVLTVENQIWESFIGGHDVFFYKKTPPARR